jgi:hypothetical protein
MTMKSTDNTKCGVCDTPVFERNNYFYGKQFTVRDLQQEQAYLNQKRRLINRMVLGWGVVCGLDVAWDEQSTTFQVCAGLALDCCGNEIPICDQQKVPFDDYSAIVNQMKTKAEYVPDRYVLCLGYRECDAEPVDLPPVDCGCNQRSEYNRIRESFQLKLVKWGDTCLAHPPDPVPCPDHVKKPVDADREQAAPCHTQTLHEYLCGRLKHCPACECQDCVILATVEFARVADAGKQDQPVTTTPTLTLDTCTWRKLVYRNPLLFDLLNCYHGGLPHIVDFNWRKAVYPTHETTFEEFVALVEGGISVTFDSSMDAGSLSRNTFLVTFIQEDEGTGSLLTKRIPPSRIDCRQEGDCFVATFVADPTWVSDELKSSHSELAEGVTVEITLRGSRIRNIKGKALDGEYLNDSLPSGNGVQGGDFVDYFNVGKRGQVRPPAQKFDRF